MEGLVLLKEKNILEILLKIFLAILCGGAIGFERDQKNKNVGMRTYMSVCLSTTIIMIIAIYCFNDTHSGDISRMAAATIQGMGFLGAGMIINRNDHLEGITSAAIMWGTAVIGLAIGYGLYLVSIIATVLMLFIGDFLQRVYKNNPDVKNKLFRK